MKRRSTINKSIVKNIFDNQEYALCHEQIMNLVKESIDRVTLYRILNGFCEDGLLHKVVDTSGKTYYAVCKSNCCAAFHKDNHIHFQCIKCKSITCTDHELTVNLSKEYNPMNVNCVIEGVCPLCNTL